MNVLPKSKNILFWYLIPIALGIHGLILCIPIALNEPTQEKPKSDPVKLQKLPSSKVSAIPKPVSSPSPVGAVISPAPIASSSVLPAASSIIPAAAQAPATNTSPASPVAPSPAPTQSTTPAPSVTPPPIATPTTTPKRTSDSFQIAGAVTCSDVKDCYSTTDPTGASVAKTIGANLEKEGYEIKEIDDILLDRPRKIYEVKKGASKPAEYIYIIWGNGTGTRTLTLSKRVDNWDELVAIAKL